MRASFVGPGGFLDSLGSSLGPWGRHKSDLCGLGLRLLRIPPSLGSFVFEVQWGQIQIFIFSKVSSEIIFCWLSVGGIHWSHFESFVKL